MLSARSGNPQAFAELEKLWALGAKHRKRDKSLALAALAYVALILVIGISTGPLAAIASFALLAVMGYLCVTL